MDPQEIPTLNPVSFFRLRTAICSLKGADPDRTKPLPSRYRIPSTDGITGEHSFASLRMGWCVEGLAIDIDVDKALERVTHPAVHRGDSVEVFIDTRDVKTSGFNTRFCHHFFFLPQAADGHVAGELTRFRSDDSHEHCDPKSLSVRTKKSKDRYCLQIFIPSSALVGYDPEQFDRLGFSYRVNQPGGGAYHFSVTSEDYSIEEQPSLWATVELLR